MTENRTVRAAAVQIASDVDSLSGTLDRSLAAIGEAAGKGAEMIVFPETFLPWYPYFAITHGPAAIEGEHLRLYENGVVVPSPVTDAIAAAARKFHAVIAMGVNERDGGSLYNSMLIFDADGSLRLKHRKITPAYHERMIWGTGDGSTIKVVDTAVGRIGGLICWEHYSPLARYSLMAQREEIHISQYPGSLFGPGFAEQTEVQLRNHALEAGCFVINATDWVTEEQAAKIVGREGSRAAFSNSSMTAIINPQGQHVVPPLTSGEGILIADLEMREILGRKRVMDSVGHFSRPDMFSFTHTTRAENAMIADTSSSAQRLTIEAAAE
ncbi:aliphatic nitrilase [Neorhizobium galegae]|uniref:nitrilase-related carbon-nitrogen hydrolase n=1 Tax=Neorhizobium galegae TaxID=399 RepID=UPI001AE6CA80|nr:nitrilase-related carbon-nitrogen hydrolase [Neorhizobium galegae]MBP2562553.1 aliphatic nitrilase [Neorhizobium galegae]